MTGGQGKITCAHYISRYLKLPENWVYKVLTNLATYTPIVLTRKKENLPLFPITSLYSLDDFEKARQYVEILFFWLFGYFRFFEQVCLQNEVKILHVHFGNQGSKMMGLKKRLKIPMVCSFYGADVFVRPKVGSNRSRYRYFFKEADKILVLGPYMKSELIRLGCAEDKISIHHLGIEVDKLRFVRRKLGKGGKVRFLIVSSFVEKKGIDLAIRALSAYQNSYDYTLDIIGDGPLRDTILREVEISGMKNRITLHGYKPYDYFITLAYECDVLIQASRTGERNNKEGTPMSIVDAMATGMAIVSTRHSDIPEIVTDGEHGYLAEENNLESLKICLQRILEAPDKIGDFGANGRKKVEEQFDARKQTVRLEEYYTDLISRQRIM